MLLYLITPSIGLLRNYVKYKQIKYLLFIRTPIFYFLLHVLLQTQNTWKILIIERWILLVYKTFVSIYNNDYYKIVEAYLCFKNPQTSRIRTEKND